MPLSTEARKAVLAVMPLLGPDQEDEDVEALLRDHWRDGLDEVGADPGFDKVRAALVRLFRTRVAVDDDVRAALTRGLAVVRDYPEQAAAGDPTLLLARHPAWVGLCALELAAWDPSVAPDPIEWAVMLASAGFGVVAGRVGTGRGEVLWAMADEADEAGWKNTSRRLLEAALDGSFHDPDHAVQVRLVLGLSLAGDGLPEAADVLEEVARSASADARTATHARHVLAELRNEAGDLEGARYWLGQALESVDPDEDPAIAERLQADLAGLGDQLDPDEETGEVAW